MGIKGLWKILKPYVRDGHISQFRGQRVAVDMYVWLHRAIIGSVRINTDKLLPYLYAKLVQGDEKATIALEDVLIVTDHYLLSVMEKVVQLQRFGVVPVCVFDGTDMPMKQGTDEARQTRRDTAFQRAMSFFEEAYSVELQTLRSPSRCLSEGIRELEKAVDISTEMAHTVIQLLREERHVECLVAPYEADAQLSYLCREGYVQAALSEDSDLIAYFCPCVISKLDSTGRCDVVKPPDIMPAFFADVYAQQQQQKGRRAAATMPTAPATSAAAASSPSLPSPTMAAPQHAPGFTYESFLLGCVLSGCDYVSSLRGIGVNKAFRLVCQSQSLSQLMWTLHEAYGFPQDELHRYRQQVLSAFYCFAHHIVYCPRLKRLVLFHPLPNLPAHHTHKESSGRHNRPDGARTSQTELTAPALKTDLVGYLWPEDVAKKVCEECLYDPCTQRLYQGTFQGCVDQYITRTRHGQASLRSFQGFERLSSAKVVVRKRERDESGSTKSHIRSFKTETHSSHAHGNVKEEKEGGDDDDALFAQPLQRVHQAGGFLGTGPPQSGLHAPAHHISTSTTSPTPAGSAAPSRAFVRSKYFLRCTAAIEADDTDTSDDETDKESQPQGGQRTLGSPSTPAATTTTTTMMSTSDEGRASLCCAPHAAPSATSVLSAAHEVPSAEAATEACSLLVGHSSTATLDSYTSSRPSSDTATHESPTTTQEDLPETQHTTRRASASPSADTRATPCACPFEYWQCNTAHSIFVQCFQGKAWVRGEQPNPPVISQLTHHPHDASEHTSDDDEGEQTATVQGYSSHASTRRHDESQTFSQQQPLATAPTTPRTPSSPSPGVHVVGAFRPPRTLSHAHDDHSTREASRQNPIRARDANADGLAPDSQSACARSQGSSQCRHDSSDALRTPLCFSTAGPKPLMPPRTATSEVPRTERAGTSADVGKAKMKDANTLFASLAFSKS